MSMHLTHMRMESYRPTNGFTLIETLVAVAIITLAVAGPLYSADRAIVAADGARDQLVASYLAQEGIEYVRAMRDNEYLATYQPTYQAGSLSLSSSAWRNFVNGSDAGSITQCRSTTCTLDPVLRPMGTGSGFALNPCSGSSCTPLYLANGVYTQQSGIAGAALTPFTRTVQAITISSNEERIVSTVSWNFHGTPYTVVIADNLTSWQ